MSAAETKVSSVSLDTIEELDNKIQTIQTLENDNSHTALALLQDEEETKDTPETVGSKIVHDLAPVHLVLVNLASDLQNKVDLAVRELQEIRIRIAKEMINTAESLVETGDIKLPSSFPVSSLSSSLTSSQSPAVQTILSIHQFRDNAVNILRAQAEVINNSPVRNSVKKDNNGGGEDFNVACDLLDTSFQQLRSWLEQLGQTNRQLSQLQNQGDTGTSSSGNNSIRKFSVEKCRDIDLLEREAVLEKMSELNVRNCSIQSRKPVRSLGHTLDLQEIMLLAKNAKSLVYEVSLQMLKMLDQIKGEEIKASNKYHKLTKENSELLRRYCLYLKLKIQQL